MCRLYTSGLAGMSEHRGFAFVVTHDERLCPIHTFKVGDQYNQRERGRGREERER